MPKITVHVPHQLDPAAAMQKIGPAIEKTVTDFQGSDLQMNASGTSAQFSFKSMGFSIKGQAAATAGDASVEVDLPIAAMMFKEKAERAIQKNLSRALENS